MHFILASTLLAIVAATPLYTNAVDSPPERRQITCQIMGEEGDTISSNAPASGVAGTTATGRLFITCDNGVKWNCGNNLPISQTVKASDTGLAKDVHWTQSWKTGGYVSCSVSYGDGNPTVDGKVGDTRISQAIGASSSATGNCGATFYA